MNLNQNLKSKMWTIIKYKKDKLNLLKKDLIDKLGKEVKLYIPKIKYQKIRRNKMYYNEHCILGDYLLIFDEKLKKIENTNLIKYCKGLKFILEGFQNSQKEINDFVNKCKSFEDNEGFLSQGFFEIFLNKSYKFLSGPFTGMIFNIIDIEQKKLKILIGSRSTTVTRNRYIFSAV